VEFRGWCATSQTSGASHTEITVMPSIQRLMSPIVDLRREETLTA
jgi:hypothetical protein